MVMLLKQAVAALTRYVQQSIAPKVQSGTELLEQFQRTRLLPTGCRRSSTYLQSQPVILQIACKVPPWHLHCCTALPEKR